jgi:hypothetical protein
MTAEVQEAAEVQQACGAVKVLLSRIKADTAALRDEATRLLAGSDDRALLALSSAEIHAWCTALEWKEAGAVKARHVEALCRSPTHATECVLALALQDDDHPAVVPAKKAVLAALASGRVPKHAQRTIARWDLTWERHDLSRLSSYFVGEVLQAVGDSPFTPLCQALLAKKSVSSSILRPYRDDDEVPSCTNIQCHRVELLCAALALAEARDRPRLFADYDDADSADGPDGPDGPNTTLLDDDTVMLAWYAACHPGLAYAPLRIARFSASEDLLPALAAHYAAADLPVGVRTRRSPLLITSSGVDRVFRYDGKPFRAFVTQMHIEAPCMAYFFPSAVEVDFEVPYGGGEVKWDVTAGREYALRDSASAPAAARAAKAVRTARIAVKARACTYLTLSTEAGTWVSAVRVYGEAVAFV